ncbi:MAG: metallophosphoesterase [Proteobacteria bacterium]|nr:metallophosphoesterase [Pseudomonadota bacterium]
MKIIIALPVIFLCLLLPGLYNALKVVPYRLSTNGVTQPIRIALVTDLHSCDYGENQRDLLDVLDAQAPDLVLLGGDIFDDILPDDNTVSFLQGISGRYPSYYVTGNHEYWSGKDGFARKMAALKKWGVIRLSGEMASINIKGSRLNICGIDDPYAWNRKISYLEHAEGSLNAQLAYVAAQPRDGAYTILLTHRPELLDTYSQYGFDLVLAGHAHGGQWRIPGILNGVYAPNQGIIPKLAGGLYEQNGTIMIVSRGLARESTWVPRIYNRPELVIIELMPK